LPPKALVWEDDQGKVWLSYNSSDYISNTIYPRGQPGRSQGEKLATARNRLEALSRAVGT
jgi:hypothetical protein